MHAVTASRSSLLVLGIYSGLDASAMTRCNRQRNTLKIVLNMDRSDLPIVCSLTPEALEARRQGLLSELLDLAEDRELLPQGMRLRFPAAPATLSAVARAVEAERQCCRFLRFSITVEPDDGPIVLELTGPPGTGEFLAGLFDQ